MAPGENMEALVNPWDGNLEKSEDKLEPLTMVLLWEFIVIGTEEMFQYPSGRHSNHFQFANRAHEGGNDPQPHRFSTVLTNKQSPSPLSCVSLILVQKWSNCNNFQEKQLHKGVSAGKEHFTCR